MNKKISWESISTYEGDKIQRTEVPGGWLVRDYISSLDGEAVALLFISDPKHEWLDDRVRVLEDSLF